MRKVDLRKSFDEKVARTCSWERFLDEALVKRAEQVKNLRGLSYYSVSDLLSEILKEVVIGPEFYSFMERSCRVQAEIYRHARDVRDDRALEALNNKHDGKAKAVTEQILIVQGTEMRH